jgi:hypothetical protein
MTITVLNVEPAASAPDRRTDQRSTVQYSRLNQTFLLSTTTPAGLSIIAPSSAPSPSRDTELEQTHVLPTITLPSGAKLHY